MTKINCLAAALASISACLLIGFARDVHAQQPPAMTISMNTTLTQQVDVFQTAAQVYTLTKSPAPNTRAQVYVNGLLMCDVCGTDYSILGTTLTFTGQQTANMDSIVVQVWYWTAN